jgi:hypothetical protein
MLWWRGVARLRDAVVAWCGEAEGCCGGVVWRGLEMLCWRGVARLRDAVVAWCGEAEGCCGGVVAFPRPSLSSRLSTNAIRSASIPPCRPSVPRGQTALGSHGIPRDPTGSHGIRPGPYGSVDVQLCGLAHSTRLHGSCVQLAYTVHTTKRNQRARYPHDST